MITIRLLQLCDVDAVVHLFTETFMREPLALITSPPREEMRLFGTALTIHCAIKNLSAVAVYRDAKEEETIVGFFLCEDASVPFQLEFPGLRPIWNILDQLQVTRVDQPKQSLHMSCVGVCDDFKHQGIAKQLFMYCLKHAKGQGFNSAFAECTSAYSIHIATQLQFEELKRLEYPDNSKCPEHRGASLMWCNL